MRDREGGREGELKHYARREGGNEYDWLIMGEPKHNRTQTEGSRVMRKIARTRIGW